ncbi:MAG: phosphodiester glycosidase family protein [bacterium]
MNKTMKLVIISFLALLFSNNALCRKQVFFDGQTVAPGIEYVYLVTSHQPLMSIHLLKVDPTKASIFLIAADNMCVSQKTTSEMARECGAMAGINGGFCDENGIPAGVCKIENSWFSDARCPRAALGWKRDGSTFFIDIINTKITLRINNKEFPVSRLNQMRRRDTAIVYAPNFATSTQTSDDGMEIIIKNGVVSEIKKNVGNSVIPRDGFVYSIGKDFSINESEIQIGMPALYDVTIIPSGSKKDICWNDLDFIIGGTPLLVADGKKIIDFSQEKVDKDFVEDQYARTAVGLLADGDVLFVAVDNDGGKMGDGVALPELADLLIGFGCTQALNLCGGKSSTMYVAGELVNWSFGFLEQIGSYIGIGGEKVVSDAIVVVPKGGKN